MAGISGSELVSKYNECLTQDERIMADYNYERFKETFEAEMAKPERIQPNPEATCDPPGSARIRDEIARPPREGTHAPAP